MKLKRVTAMAASFVMALSLMGGLSVATKSMAKVNAELPKTVGLYRTEWVSQEYDEKTDSDYIMTDTDANGNVIMVDHDGNQVRYRDQDDPKYLTEGVKEGWGPDCAPVDTLWFDYVNGKKVTHVDVSDLKFTNLDGSVVSDVDFEAAMIDPRAVSVNAKKTGPVLVTYKGAKKNNKMVLSINLNENFYTANPATVESYVSSDQTVVTGKTKDVYLDLITDWEEAGYKFDPATMLTVEYWDDAKGEDVRVTGADTSKFVTVTPLSEDTHHPVYKLTVNGVIPAEHTNSFRIRCQYKKYNFNDGESSAWDEDRDINFKLVEANSFTALDTNRALYIDGNNEFNVWREDNSEAFSKEFWYDAVPGVPVYTAFRYIDADGNATYVTDPKDLTIYDLKWVEGAEKPVLGDKVPDNTLTIDPAGDKTPVLMINYFPEDLRENGDREFLVVYKDAQPDPDHGIHISFEYNGYGDAFYRSKNANADSYFNMYPTYGNEDIKVYLAISGNFGLVKSAKYKSVSLTDSKGHDYGDMVKVKSDAGVKFENGRTTINSFEFTIPAGVVFTSCKLNVKIEVGTDYGGTEEWSHFNCYIMKYPAQKGSKYTLDGVTYKVTGNETASVCKVKAGAKKVTIPRFAGVMKVTAIEKNAMKGCKKLTKIDVESEYIKSVGKGAFDGVPAKAVAKVPKSKKKAYSKMFKKAGFKGKVK